VTGKSGIGKTSVLRRAVRDLKIRKYEVGGMICREVREGGIRMGFEIMDLSTGIRGWLAHVDQPNGPKIGKYHVNLTDLEIIGVGAILDALQNVDILAIDELGPMEFSSKAFSEALVKAVGSEKPLIGTIHYGLKNSIIDSIRNREETKILKVTYGNRAKLHNQIVNKVSLYLTEMV
jgi:nucleoside-triphosphatase